MMSPFVSFLFFALFTLLARANTPIPDSVVQTYLQDRGGFELAWLSRPMWHFGSMRPAFYFTYYPTCWPSPALNSTNQQHGTPPQKWPDAATGCPPPNTPFPTYYVVRQCSPTEIRIIYSLYYTHDGFSNLVIASGHEHDWERIVVVWRKTDSNEWVRKELYASMHSGYTRTDWDKVDNTFYEGEEGVMGKNGADLVGIFPGWAKHPMFLKKETGWRDTISQGCDREYRSDNWKYLPRKEDMIDASKKSEMGILLSGFDWGKATGGPWAAEEGICTIKAGNYIKC